MLRFNQLVDVIPSLTKCVSIAPTIEPTIFFTDIQCITRVSEASGTGDGDTTYIKCNSGETLTSCGFESESFDDKLNRHGSAIYISTKTYETDSCESTNMNGGLGVRAHARCCSFTEAVGDISCTGVQSGYELGDSWMSCVDTSHKYLLGCSAYSPFNSMVGSYPDFLPPLPVNFPLAYKLATGISIK